AAAVAGLEMHLPQLGPGPLPQFAPAPGGRRCGTQFPGQRLPDAIGVGVAGEQPGDADPLPEWCGAGRWFENGVVVGVGEGYRQGADGEQGVSAALGAVTADQQV